MEQKKPFISALLVTRNEKDYIRMSLMSLIKQTYPKSNYEIIVIDGESDDGTVDVVNAIRKEYCTDGFNIDIISNPKRILAAGWNLGIKAAKGEYVVRIDAHATAEPDFIERNVETMLRVDAACVGGKLTTKSLKDEGGAVSLVLSSPFGVGNSSFRVSDSEGYADTAVYGLYKKDIFERVGYFDEQMVRNQDIELHSRIKKAGGKFYFNPDIKSTYYSRTTVKKMLKQAFGNGQWNMVLIKRGSGALSLRHLVPLFFVLFLIITVVGGFFIHWLWWIALSVMCLHLFLGVVFSLKKTKQLKQIVQMPLLFMSLHTAYGLGYIKGLFN